MARGGARKGAGRPALYGEAMFFASIRLTQSQIDLALELGEGNVAKGVRAVFDAYTKAPTKAVTKPMKVRRKEKTYEEKMAEYFADKGIVNPSINMRMRYMREYPEG